jgi:hypothetical protein
VKWLERTADSVVVVAVNLKETLIRPVEGVPDGTVFSEIKSPADTLNEFEVSDTSVLVSDRVAVTAVSADAFLNVNAILFPEPGAVAALMYILDIVPLAGQTARRPPSPVDADERP